MKNSKIALGVTWTYAGMAISMGLQVGVTAITARLLSPTAFGLIALANVVLRLAGFFSRLGVGRAVVQRVDLDDGHIYAAVVISALTGVAFTCALILAAPLVAVAFAEDGLAPVLRSLAFTFLFVGIAAVPQAILQRSLDFRKLSLVESGSYALGYAAPVIILASQGFGVWSLVAGALGQSGALALASWLVAGVESRQDTKLQKHHFTDLLGFGSSVSFISFVEFVTINVDTLAIGRFGESYVLGIYNRAMMLPNLALYRLHYGVSRVLQPVFARRQTERQEFRRTLYGAIYVSAGIILPAAIGMSLGSKELVAVVLGPQWGAAVPIMKVLSIGVAFNLLSWFPDTALEARAMLSSKLRIHLATLFVLVLCVWFVYGVVGSPLWVVALAVSVVYGGRTMALLWMCVARDLLDRASVWKLIARMALSSALAVLVMGVGSRAVGIGSLPAIKALALYGILGLLVLLLLNWGFARRGLRALGQPGERGR